MGMKECERIDKKIRIFCLALLALFLLFTHTACGKEGRNAGSDDKDVESMAPENLLGGEMTFQSVLNGEALKVEKAENPCMNILEGILRGDKNYRKEHKEMEKSILEYVKDSTSGFLKNEKVYLSLHPVFSWDAMENTVIFSNPSALFLPRIWMWLECVVFTVMMRSILKSLRLDLWMSRCGVLFRKILRSVFFL